MTPDQERIRAESARQILDNPLYKEAMTALKADLFQKFEKTSWLQAKERTEIWRTLKNLNNLDGYLTRIFTTGKMIRK